MATKINLSLPKHWNLCSTKQLELIADVIREQSERHNRYRPFSMYNVKVALFFALSGIKIVAGPNPRVPVEEQYYTCCFQNHRSRWFSIGHKSDTFSIYLWQLNYWLSPSSHPQRRASEPSSPESLSSGAGILDWLDNTSGQFLTKFPYPLIKRRHRSRWFSIGQSFQGPQKDLDGFTWSQYRLSTEAMQNYITLSNNLIKMQQMNKFSDDQLRQQSQSVDMAKSLFLATIFNRKVKHVETSTGIIRKDYHYESNQITDNAEFFRNFPDTKWQVILFWWTGIMHTLSHRYPHVFKTQNPKPKTQNPSSALDIYTSTIATMQKYVGINEQECNNQSYSLVLEQLERISKENEQLERLRQK